MADIGGLMCHNQVMFGINNHRLKAHFLSTIELANQLEHEKQIGKQGRLANRLIYTDLIILDELGYLPSS